MLTSFTRVWKFAFQNFWRNFWLSFITVSMLTLALLSANVLLVLTRVTDKAVEAVEDRIEVSVYFKPNIPQERLTGATSYLRALPQVRDVEIVTGEEALDRFKRRHANDEAILASLTEVDRNPFGPSLVVRAKSANDFPFILDALQNPQFRDDIRDKDFGNYAQIIDRIRQTTDRIRLYGLGLAALFLAIAVMIVSNTVRMGIFIHREEIGVMKLVGATDRFVKAPFLLEAIIYSLLATALVAGIILPLVAALEPSIDGFMGPSHPTRLVEFFQQNGLMIFGAEFLGLSLLNMIATSFAMRKYLRV